MRGSDTQAAGLSEYKDMLTSPWSAAKLLYLFATCQLAALEDTVIVYA